MPPDMPAVAPSAVPPQLAIEKHTSHLQLDYYYNRTITKSPLKRTGWRGHASVASASSTVVVLATAGHASHTRRLRS